MSVEEAQSLVTELRQLRKNPQKLSSKMVDGTETSRKRKAPTIAKAQGANLANAYLAKYKNATVVVIPTTVEPVSTTDATVEKIAQLDEKPNHSQGSQPNLL